MYLFLLLVFVVALIAAMLMELVVLLLQTALVTYVQSCQVLLSLVMEVFLACIVLGFSHHAGVFPILPDTNVDFITIVLSDVIDFLMLSIEVIHMCHIDFKVSIID